MLTTLSTINPQTRLTTNLDRTLDRTLSNFLNYFDEDFNSPISSVKYPPYNILKKDDDQYLIRIAVAGFNKDELMVEVENNMLTVTGQKNIDADVGSEYQVLYQGIAERSFKRQFKLQAYIEVSDVELKDGLLNISLVRIVPEELKPKRLEIK